MESKNSIVIFLLLFHATLFAMDEEGRDLFFRETIWKYSTTALVAGGVTSELYTYIPNGNNKLAIDAFMRAGRAYEYALKMVSSDQGISQQAGKEKNDIADYESFMAFVKMEFSE